MSEDVVEVVSFDGQTVWLNKSTALYEVGNFLGGGAAGTVYEAEHVKTKEHFALKILTPLGYKLLSPALLRRCTIITKGKPVSDIIEQGEGQLLKEHIWWLLNGSTKQYIAGYHSEKSGILKEFSLKQCMTLWGHQPIIGENDDSKLDILQSPGGGQVYVPMIPPKYADFVRRRTRIFREIHNMRKISNHRNVIRLESVLELAQESKCTIFLVMELANGGELFDRIKIDCGTREETAVLYFRQVLDGVQHCHEEGVCHRDLKPENLLLQDSPGNGTVLKIADFGFSAWVAVAISNDNWDGNDTPRLPEVQHQVYAAGTPTDSVGASLMSQTALLAGSPLRVLNSVVGSPFYVAPEVLQARGYDGYKADVWSLGVILYAMLAGNLPFSQDLATCKRFRAFCKWVREMTGKGVRFYSDYSIEYPEWLFHSKFSPEAKSLIVSMLHPDPTERVSVIDAMNHPWCMIGIKTMIVPSSIQQQNQVNVNQGIVSIAPVSGITQQMDTISMVHTTSMNNGEGSNSNIEMIMYDEFETSTHAATDGDDAMHIIDEDDDGIFPMDDAESIRNQSGFSEITQRSESSSPAQQQQARRLPQSLLTDRLMGTTSPPLTGHVGQSPLVAHSMDRPHSVIAAIGTPAISNCVPVPVQVSVITSSNKRKETPIIMSRSVPTKLDSPPLPQFSLEQLIGGGPPADLFTQEPEEDEQLSSQIVGSIGQPHAKLSSRAPSFHEHVKRSTRFLTSVDAGEVFEKIECILNQCKNGQLESPIGPIRKVELSWKTYRLEVWGTDIIGPPLCSIQLYRLPQPTETTVAITAMSPSRMTPTSDVLYTTTHGTTISSPRNATAPGLFLVEFVRGPIEIFAFKRFYNWLRQHVAELVKRDYGCSSLDYFGSPARITPYFTQMTQELDGSQN
jgi:serine/threonine protein kinase